MLFLAQLLPAFEIDDARTAKFLDSIPEKMAQPPWNYSGTKEQGLTVSLSVRLSLPRSSKAKLMSLLPASLFIYFTLFQFYGCAVDLVFSVIVFLAFASSI